MTDRLFLGLCWFHGNALKRGLGDIPKEIMTFFWGGLLAYHDGGSLEHALPYGYNFSQAIRANLMERVEAWVRSKHGHQDERSKYLGHPILVGGNMAMEDNQRAMSAS